MSIRYKVVKMRQPALTGGQGEKYQARVCDRDFVSFADLCRSINNGTTFSESDVTGVAGAMLEHAVKFLLRGSTVDLGPLGLFSVHIQSELKERPDEVNSLSIKEAKVHHRLSKEMKEKMKFAEYQKAK